MKLKSLSLFCIVIVFSITSFAQDSIPTAKAVMKATYEAATKQNKKVLLIFHASWCGWCKKMDNSLNDKTCKDLFDKYFIIEHLTVQESKGKENLENPGAQEMMDGWDGKQQGLPYWVILDKDGNLLFDSQIRTEQPDGNMKGSNTGCPASKAEVDYFIGLLRKTTQLNDDELQIIETRFRQNESK